MSLRGWQAPFAILLLSGCASDDGTATDVTGGNAEPDVTADTHDLPDADAASRDTSPDGTDAETFTPTSLFLSDRFLHIAHRGGGRQAPEETMPAYELALQNGADVIECDVHTSSDGVVVCIHDTTVDRTTDGSGPVNSMTWAQLQELDAGYVFSPDGGQSYPYRDQGVRIAALDALLESFPDAWVAIEIKQSQPPMLDEFLDVIDRHNAADRIVVASFDDLTIQTLRTERPELLTALALGEMFELQTAIGDPNYSPPALIVQAPKAQVTRELLDFAHSLGMKVHAWTVNNRDDMEALIEIGVDGIFTDDPVLLEDVLRR